MKDNSRKAYNATSEIGGRKPDPKTGLSHDYVNAWVLVALEVDRAESEKRPLVLQPVKTYEVYVHKVWQQDVKNGLPDFSEYVLNDSDSRAVTSINNLVEKFNAAIPEIVSTSDYNQVHEFVEQALKIIRD